METNGEDMYDCDDNIYSFIHRDDNIYSFIQRDTWSKQEVYPITLDAKQLISENKDVKNGQLKRINKQLRIESDILTKYFPIIPRSSQTLRHKWNS